MKSFKNRLVYITGGSSGIGYAAAEAFLKEGASVLLIARDQGKLEKAGKSLLISTGRDSDSIATASVDISEFKRVTEVLEDRMNSIGIPDILINGAGMAYPDYFDRIPHEIFVKTININLIGTWNVISVVVPRMKERGGHLVNISSVEGYVGTFGYAAYSASKFGIIGFSEVLKGELKPYSIDVSVLCPPDTDTPQLKEEDRTKPPETRAISGNVKIMQPGEVAAYLLKGIRRRKFMILPGFMNKITYIIKRMAPWLVFMIMDGDIKRVQKDKHKE
ncbi:MAG: short-chain dehydrogenase [Spirochaetes bacterium]|nr:MAG: short-chain dehydrogenase [Spirochaetota bacterium]